MRQARLGVILAGFAALGLAAWAEGCLFAPEDCGDLLKCRGAGGAGGDGSTSSTSSSGSTSTSTTGTGCMTGTGCVSCQSDLECQPPSADGCTIVTCVASVCTPKDTTGNLSAIQTPNDCKKNVCDADAKPVSMDDPTDLPADDGKACTDQVCIGGAPTFVPVVPGTPCANGTCDDQGNCFNCLKDLDCKTGVTPSCDLTLHTCISCSDGIKNGTETGVDCGGSCKGCGGVPCGKNADCASSVCFAGLCQIPTGGDCTSDLTCASGLCSSLKCTSCAVASDCASTSCNAPVCKAPGGTACGVDGDCATGTCQFGLCLVSNGGACAVNAGCLSGVCAGGVCTACGPINPCPAGASCGQTSFGTNTCNRPKGAYCTSQQQCQGLKPCTGFPPVCL